MLKNSELKRVIRSSELYPVTGLRKTQIAALIARGQFPKPIKLTDGGRAKGWIEAEIVSWQTARLAKRDAA